MANADISLLNVDNTLYTYFDVLLIYEAWIQIYVLAGRSKFFWNALASRMSVRKSLCFHPEVKIFVTAFPFMIVKVNAVDNFDQIVLPQIRKCFDGQGLTP